MDSCPAALRSDGILGAAEREAITELYDQETSVLKEKLRQMGLIKRAIQAVDETVLDKFTNMMRTSSTPGPLRLYLVYRLDELEAEGLQDEIDLLKNTIMPRVAGEISKRMMVKRPTVGPLKLLHPCDRSYVLEVLLEEGQKIDKATRNQIQIAQTLCFSWFLSADYCGPVALGINHDPNVFNQFRVCNNEGECARVSGEGVDADFVLYVTSTSKGCMGGQIAAFSSPCYMSTKDARPLAGYVNFCPNSIKYEAVDVLVETGLHEIMHSLYFNNALFEYYVDWEGNPKGRDKVVRKTESGALEVISRNTVDAARKHFTCQQVDGVPLENDGGCGTANNHWEASLFQGELMTAQAPSSVSFDRAVWSSITLGLAQDSGWYLPANGGAQILQFGYQQGCSFALDNCWKTAKAGSEFYCLGTYAGCTYDRLATAQCSAIPDGGTCRTMQPINTQSDCLNPDVQPEYAFQSHGEFSRCIEGDSQVPGVNVDGGTCMRMVCEKQKLYLIVSSQTVECPPGRYLDVTAEDGVSVVRVGPCPRPSDICPELSCPKDCSSNGRCIDGTCQCFLGYNGEDCSKTICYEGSCGKGLQCNQETGLCELIITQLPDPAELGLPIPGFANWPTPAPAPLPPPSPNGTAELDDINGTATPTPAPAPAIGGGGFLSNLSINAGSLSPVQDEETYELVLVAVSESPQPSVTSAGVQHLPALSRWGLLWVPAICACLLVVAR